MRAIISATLSQNKSISIVEICVVDAANVCIFFWPAHHVAHCRGRLFPFVQCCAQLDPQILRGRSQWTRLARHPSEPAAVWVSWLDSLDALSRARLSVQSDLDSSISSLLQSLCLISIFRYRLIGCTSCDHHS